MIKNKSDPNFETAITIPYFIEQTQQLKFSMVDNDGDSDDENDYIGGVETTMADLMSAPNQVLEKELKRFSKYSRTGESEAQGRILVRA